MMLASKDILNVPERVDWKQCKIDPTKERGEVERLKKGFKPYDFTAKE